MVEIFLDRRTFLAGSLSTTAALCVADGRAVLADDLAAWLLTSVAGSADLLDPDRTSPLPDAEVGRLLGFSNFLVETWGLGPYVPGGDGAIAGLIDAKSTSAPSYFTEYTLALETMDRAAQSLGNVEQAYDLLAFGVFEAPEMSLTRIGRFRAFVFEEFARYLIVSGGFRRFKPKDGAVPAKNYNGYAGGSFDDPDKPPYRDLGT